MDKVHLCFTSIDLDELSPEDQKDDKVVARALAKAGRFSVFDATATQTLAHTMDRITRSGWFKRENLGYPWTGVKLTEKGKKALEDDHKP